MAKKGCLITLATLIAATLFIFFFSSAIESFVNRNRVPIERPDYITSTTPREAPKLDYYYYMFDEDKYDSNTLKVIDAFFNQEPEVFIDGCTESEYWDIKYSFDSFLHGDYISTRWFLMCYNLDYEATESGINIFISYIDNELSLYLDGLKAAEKIISQMDFEYMTDIGVVKETYDYIILNTEYADYAFDNPYSDEIENHASGAFAGKAVSGGYAQAYSLLLSLAGIENRYVAVEKDLNHAWNMVEIDGTWYHCDPAYDDLPFDGYISYKYFMKNDAYMEMAESGRMQIDLPADGESYFFESMGYELYKYKDKIYAITLIDDNLVRYEVKNDIIDKESEKIMVRNVLSWCLPKDISYIVYNDIYKGHLKTTTVDRRFSSSYSYIEIPDYIVSAVYDHNVLTVSYAEGMHGELYEINVRKD